MVSDIQVPSRDDAIGRRLGGLTDRLHAHHPRRPAPRAAGRRDRRTSCGNGFTGDVLRIERAWPSHPGYELNFIRNRAWSALRRLDDHDYNRVTGPAIAALEALPQEETN